MYSRYGRDWSAESPAPVRESPATKPPPVEEPVKKGGLPSLLSRFTDMDKGDMLLLAVLVFLLIEGEDIEIVILIALVLFIGR